MKYYEKILSTLFFLKEDALRNVNIKIEGQRFGKDQVKQKTKRVTRKMSILYR